MGVASAFTGITSFAAPVTTGLPTATANTTLAMLATAIAAAGSEYLTPIPEISE